MALHLLQPRSPLGDSTMNLFSSWHSIPGCPKVWDISQCSALLPMALENVTVPSFPKPSRARGMWGDVPRAAWCLLSPLCLPPLPAEAFQGCAECPGQGQQHCRGDHLRHEDCPQFCQRGGRGKRILAEAAAGVQTQQAGGHGLHLLHLVKRGRWPAPGFPYTGLQTRRGHCFGSQNSRGTMHVLLLRFQGALPGEPSLDVRCQ